MRLLPLLARASSGPGEKSSENAPENRSRGGAVYVSGARVRTSDQPIANATIVAEEMHSWLREIDGFEGFVMLTGEGSTIGLAFWESRDAAERHRVARMQFLERMTSVAGVEIEEVLDYEVTFAELGPLKL
jgi:hypothetical protein